MASDYRICAERMTRIADQGLEEGVESKRTAPVPDTDIPVHALGPDDRPLCLYSGPCTPLAATWGSSPFLPKCPDCAERVPAEQR